MQFEKNKESSHKTVLFTTATAPLDWRPLAEAQLTHLQGLCLQRPLVQTNSKLMAMSNLKALRPLIHTHSHKTKCQT